MQPNLPQKKERLQIDVPWSTFLRGTSLLFLLLITYKLGFLIGLILIAILLAVTLDGLMGKLESHGVKRRLAFYGIIAGMLLFTFLMFFVVAPTIFSQMQSVGEKIPQIREDILKAAPHGKISNELEKLWSNPEKLIGNWGDLILKLGTFLTQAISALVIVVTFSFYFLIDGKRTFDWLISFFTLERQTKLRSTSTEVTKIISAYVSGQLITSGLAFTFTAVLLSALQVPAWLMVAFLAAILDMVPVVGILITISAIGVLGLTVSPMTSLYACAAALLYQGLENYLISPRVYGNALRLSNLAVLMAFAVGGLLAGPIGVILALPIAAAYPPVERIWLRRYLGEKVVEKHKQIEKRPTDFDNRTSH